MASGFRGLFCFRRADVRHIWLLNGQIIQNLTTNRCYHLNCSVIFMNSMWIARQFNLFLLETLSARADVGISVKTEQPRGISCTSHLIRYKP